MEIKHRKSIGKIRADGSAIINKSLPIIIHRLDRLPIRLRILATHLVPQAGFVSHKINPHL